MMWLLSSLPLPSVLCCFSFLLFCSHLPQSLHSMPLIHAWRSHLCEWENKTSAPRHLAPSRVSLWVCWALGEIIKMGPIGVKVVKTMKYPQMHCSVMIHAPLFKNKHKKLLCTVKTEKMWFATLRSYYISSWALKFTFVDVTYCNKCDLVIFNYIFIKKKVGAEICKSESCFFIQTNTKDQQVAGQYANVSCWNQHDTAWDSF